MSAGNVNKNTDKTAQIDPCKTLSAMTASTRGSDLLSACVSNNNQPLHHYSAFMTNKAGAKTPYILQLGEGELRVLSFSKGSMKAKLTLATMHAKLAPKQQSISDIADVADVAATNEESKETPNWYPLKLMLTLKKSRMLFFESRRQRKEVLEAILTEQGFAN